MKTTPSDLRGYGEILARKEAELLHVLGKRDDIAVERSADQLEEIQCAATRDVAIRNLGRGFDLLREVRAALVRIRNGSFGICVECEGAIGPKRIAALPWAPLCIRCQEAAAARNGHEIGETLSQVLAGAA
ncbi:MAG: TraR/DksA family transcriptional regulator [Bryobacteraceae bacterium]|jgi:RNA polymerase-binding transcription factor DksA